MIQALSAQNEEEFSAVIGGRPYFRAVMGRDRALWYGNPGAPVRLFCLPGAALRVCGGTAQLCGIPQDWQELCSFLRFVGVQTLLSETAPPPGTVRRAEALYLFTLPRGGCLPLNALPRGLTLSTAPSVGALARQLFPESTARQDDYYSETCTAIAHGYARVLALLDESGSPVSTVGAYAMANGEAHMAMGCTVPERRGQGIGGWLIPYLADDLAADGWDVTLLCSAQRRPFYARLGFQGTARFWQLYGFSGDGR